ncbi:hypothetical protein AMS68_007162 [Peltaster fructicola]|uniref:DNA-directed RNA polymerase I, II, and III subunit RPABC4 n=1 Tax=Peltaster fructicola TaxID=286661 RepID=A0A6H0Y3Y8_9PEZI|nr:hypothetical protein AMS68_007162 [Peltaster fructicola]
MSREAYTPNFNPSTTQGGSSQNATTNPFAVTSANTFEDTNRAVQYLCGDCDAKVTLKRGDPIRCKECGYRILYKERTNRMIQFEAR